MEGEDPEPWLNEYTDSQWQALFEQRELVRIEKTAADKEKAKRKDAWRELRNSMTVEEADAYIFNLTKLGMTQAAIARALGMTSVSQYMRRYKERNDVGTT